MALSAARDGGATSCCRKPMRAEAALVEAALVYPATSLLEVCAHLTGQRPLERCAARAGGERRRVPGPCGGEGTGARQARARNRRRGRAQRDHGGPAGHGQDHARRAPARDTAADDAAGGARRRGGAVAGQRGLRRRELEEAAVSRAASHRLGRRAGRRRRPVRVRARSRWRCTACSSSTSCPSSTAGCWKCCASRSSPAASASRAPRGRRSSRRNSSS